MDDGQYEELVTRMMESAVDAADEGNYEEASECFRALLEVSDSGDFRSYCLLSLGRVEEKLQEWAAALEWYLQALALDQGDEETRYFLSNNAGYCMNRLGRHAEAEALCRAAVSIDPERPNAWKNLGIALEGLGRWSAAASSYLEATEVCPEDTRSLHLLERLIDSRPQAADGVPDYGSRIVACRKAAEMAGEE